MNPSASGWIKKFLTVLPESSIVSLERKMFYHKLKQTGFIYGSNVSCLYDNFDGNAYNEEERCKINLITSFFYIYKTEKSTLDFVDSVVEFYKTTDEHKRSFLLDLFGEPSKDKLLEQIIHKRIHIDDNIITKNFNYFLINAFLSSNLPFRP